MLRMYDYSCEHCGHSFEALVEVEERKFQSCPECDGRAKQALRKVPMLDPRMGIDPDFPTAYRNWANKHEKLSDGRMKDSNNTRYGTHRDYDREAYDKRKQRES